MIVTILGSCRQDSIYNLENVTVTTIKDEVSYPHYSNEIIEVIKFCKYGHISSEETITVFRTPILKNKPIIFNSKLKQEFESTNVFIIEIASRKAYKLNKHFVHHILYDLKLFNKNKDKIQFIEESDEEIEENILWIKKELNRPIIIVCHISTYNKGTRYELSKTLEQICNKHNIMFLNPVKELLKRGYDINTLVVKEEILSHYNDLGHSVIKGVYKDYLMKMYRKKIILVFSDSLTNITQNSDGHFFGLGDLFRAVISMYQFSKKYDFELFVDFQHHPLSNFLQPQYHPYNDLIRDNKDNIRYIRPVDVEEYIINNVESVDFFMTNSVFDDPITDECKEFVKNILVPNEEMEKYIEEKRKSIPYNEYNIIHYRLGDDELIKNDVNELNLLIAAKHLVDGKIEENSILMSDSMNFKKIIKMNRDIFMFDIDIAHFGYNEHRERIKDTLFEFFIVIKSKSIRTSSVYGWPSGFVKIANDIYDVPMTIVV